MPCSQKSTLKTKFKTNVSKYTNPPAVINQTSNYLTIYHPAMDQPSTIVNLHQTVGLFKLRLNAKIEEWITKREGNNNGVPNCLTIATNSYQGLKSIDGGWYRNIQQTKWRGKTQNRKTLVRLVLIGWIRAGKFQSTKMRSDGNRLNGIEQSKPPEIVTVGSS